VRQRPEREVRVLGSRLLEARSGASSSAGTSMPGEVGRSDGSVVGPGSGRGVGAACLGFFSKKKT
jgi:hypothetical protein